MKTDTDREGEKINEKRNAIFMGRSDLRCPK